MIQEDLITYETAVLAKSKGFVEIPIAPDYLINKEGIILGLDLQEMKPSITSKGYCRILLSKPYRKKHLVHRLVALTFIKNPTNKPQVNHKDGNKQNNHVDNLEWCTHSENGLHSYQFLGRTKFWENKKGNDNPLSKTILCVDTGEIFENALDAQLKTGINDASINRCCNGYRATAGDYIWKYFNNSNLTDLARIKGFQSLDDEDNLSLLYMTLLAKWLRVNHNIHITVGCSEIQKYNLIVEIAHDGGTTLNSPLWKLYDSYEEAYETGLQYALNLI